MEGLSKRTKDSWTWTTVWGLLGGDIRGLKGNGKYTIKNFNKIKYIFKKVKDLYDLKRNQSKKKFFF